MQKINWDARLNLGIARIDDQHRNMVELVNALTGKLNEGKGEEIVRPLLSQLREYTVYHFHDEEVFMEEIKYPGFEKHRQEHKGLVNQVKNFQRDIYEHRTVLPSALLTFLKDWLLDHILKQDMQIGAFVREQKAQRITAAEADQGEAGQEKKDG